MPVLIIRLYLNPKMRLVDCNLPAPRTIHKTDCWRRTWNNAPRILVHKLDLIPCGYGIALVVDKNCAHRRRICASKRDCLLDQRIVHVEVQRLVLPIKLKRDLVPPVRFIRNEVSPSKGVRNAHAAGIGKLKHRYRILQRRSRPNQKQSPIGSSG